LREAVVNSLIHTDHEASGGIVVTRQPHLFLFENPGDIRIPIEQALAGGVSDCRNPALQRMFRMIGLGDQLGSGVPRMRRAWEEQMWRMPGLWEDVESYRTSLLLPTMSLLPEGAIAELRDLYGEAKFGSLSQDQVLAAVTAHVEGQVSRGRLLAMSAMHPADIAAMLKDMVADGLLTQIQPRRGVYRLPRPAGAEPVSRRQGSSYSADSSSYSADSSSYSADSSLQSIPNTPLFSQTALPLNEPSEDSAVPVASDLDVLRRIAESVATKHWQPRALMREVIVALCRVRPLRLAEMAQLMNRKPESLRQQYLIPLIEERQLQYLYPGEPTHPQQAYTSSDLNRSHE
jgi:ATP-dependent DNA helicase RecG